MWSNLLMRPTRSPLRRAITLTKYLPVYNSIAEVKLKGKVLPYPLPSVGPGADPGVQAVSPQVTWSHPPGCRLPLLSARSAITFPANILRHSAAVACIITSRQMHLKSTADTEGRVMVINTDLWTNPSRRLWRTWDRNLMSLMSSGVLSLHWPFIIGRSNMLQNSVRVPR